MPHDSAPAVRSDPRFRLAIVGGGIAGLTLAVTLGRYEERCSPIQIDLYEAGPDITTVGAGISIWQRTWAVMRELGIYEQLADEAVKSTDADSEEALKPGFIFRKSDWPREGYEFGRVMMPSGSTTMHRAEMVDVLMRNLPKTCAVHTSKRLVKYTRRKTKRDIVYILHFADGTTAEADVVIGADGIKSKTRASMYEYAHEQECARNVKREDCERCSRAKPKWTGTVAYRYLIPAEKLNEVAPNHRAVTIKTPMSYCGKEKHIITYPISHGKYLNWVGFVTIHGAEGTTYPHKWVIDAQKEELLQHFSGWEPEVDQMLACIEKPTIWAIHVVENLPFSVHGRVAIMGDAVHAMTTHFGAGGGQAIEDAYILGRWLADRRVSLPRVIDVFRIYQDIRLPFARTVVQNARKAGLMYEFNPPGLYNGFTPLASSEAEELELTKERLCELGGAIQNIWRWQWVEKVEDQWKEAEKRFSQVLDSDSVGGADEKRSRWGCLIM